MNKKGEKETVAKCLDLWMFTLAWHTNALLEANEQATEKLRNGLCEVDPKTNQTIPKAIKLTLIKATHERLHALPDL